MNEWPQRYDCRCRFWETSKSDLQREADRKYGRRMLALWAVAELLVVLLAWVLT